MAASDKRRRAGAADSEGAQQDPQQPENESDSEGGDSDDMLDEVEKEVQVDFEAVTPTDSDFNGIKQLLQQLFLKAHVNLSELTDLLIKQNYVCSVVKQSESPEDDDDDDDMDTTDEDFGVISIVNLTSNKEMNCVKQIKTLLLTKCKENGQKNIEERLQELIGETATINVGLLLSERFINIPPQIALPLYESLDKDLKVAREKGKPFHFDHFVFICKVYKDEKNASVDSIIYANAEEELLAEESDVQFDYSVAHEIDSGLGGRWTEDDETLKPYRRVLVVPANKWETLLGKLRAELVIKT